MQTKIWYTATVTRSYKYQSAEITLGAEVTLGEGDDAEQAERELQASINAKVKRKSAAALRDIVNEAEKFEQERIALLRARNEAQVAAIEATKAKRNK